MQVYDSNGRLYIKHNNQMCMLVVNDENDLVGSRVTNARSFAGWKEENLVYEQVIIETGNTYTFKDIKPNHNMVIQDVLSPSNVYTYSKNTNKWSFGSYAIALEDMGMNLEFKVLSVGEQ